jgi:hypothetical protein
MLATTTQAAAALTRSAFAGLMTEEGSGTSGLQDEGNGRSVGRQAIEHRVDVSMCGQPASAH